MIRPKINTVFEPDVVIYDNYPGGIGQSDPLFRRQQELLKAALDLAAKCECEAGWSQLRRAAYGGGDAGQARGAAHVKASW